MKKVVIGFICGAFLMFSGQALANEISLVGKKVGSEATVIIDGKEVSNAVIIEGKSYAPVRDIAEELNGSVDWREGKSGERSVISITSNERDNISPSELKNHDLLVAKQRKGELLSEIEELKESIKYQEEEFIPMLEKNLSNGVPGSAAYEEGQLRLKEYQDLVKTNKEKLQDLETELVTIEYKIAELQDNPQ